MAADSVALPQRQRKLHHRSRRGCQTCRGYKLKCDETKPICQRCLRRGFVCIGVGYATLTAVTTAPSMSARQSALERFIYPSSAPQINGTAEIRDLMQLVPEILQARNDTQTLSPITSVTGYIMSRGKPVGLYLDFLPARTGFSLALDSAVGCIVCALRDILRPASLKNLSTTLSSYGKALKHLQAALDDPAQCSLAETLCATQLLGIFESLVSDNGETTLNHTQGTTQLVQIRGPKGFSTDFEKALLVAQAPVINIAALFQAQVSFIHRSDWRAAIKSAAMEHPTNIDISELGISKFDIMLPLPGIMKDITNTIIMEDGPERTKLHAKALRDVKKVRKQLVSWYRRWRDVVQPPHTKTIFTEFGRGDGRESRIGYYIFYQSYMVVYDRLYMTLDRNTDVELEYKVREMARSIINNPIVQTNAASRIELAVAWRLATTLLGFAEEWEAWMRARDATPKTHLVLPRPEMWYRYLSLHGIFPPSTGPHVFK